MTRTNDIGASGFAGLGLDPQRTSTSARKELGQQEFFELMVAQLKHQDPLKPLDSNEFLGQVAQFTAVRGIQDMQRSFADLASALGSSQALQASTLVGREVLVPGGLGYLSETGGVAGAVRVPEATRELGLTVYDSVGRVVRQINLGARPAGDVEFAWDGVTDGGQRATPGTYAVAASVELGGQKVAAETLVLARVESVTLGRAGAEMQLNLAGLGPIGLGTVREIL
jgi:flagellar basal-body rod modification protein FlgD